VVVWATVPRLAGDSRGLVVHYPSAREGDSERATNAIGHPCRHGAKEPLPEPRGEDTPTREERHSGADQKEGEGTHQETDNDRARGPCTC